MQDAFKKAIFGQSIWRQPMPSKYTLVTTQSFEFLKNISEPSDSFLKHHKLAKTSLDSTQLKLLAAAELADEKGIL